MNGSRMCSGGIHIYEFQRERIVKLTIILAEQS